MLSAASIDRIAVELADAAMSRELIPLISRRYPHATIEDAYKVQQRWVERQRADGRQVVGRKIGLTSRAMQQATGITEPDYGVIFDNTIWPDGSSIPVDDFVNVRVEVELAFVLKQPLSGPECQLVDVLEATAYISPALEILNSHVELEGRTVVDTIADNAAYGGIIVGEGRINPTMADLRWVSAMLYLNDNVEETGVAAGVLDHPGNGVAWLANKLHAHGVSLQAGDTILSGSFTRPVWIARGDRVRCDYGEAGTVTCRFH